MCDTVSPMRTHKTNLERLYEATPEVVMPVPLKKDDYPNVKFWELDQWSKWVNQQMEMGNFKNGMQGQGMNSSFMEDTEGYRVSVTWQKQILEEVHTSWRTMQAFEIELKPLRSMPAPPRDYFRARLAVKCPELRLCANHWKVDRVWRKNFSSWNPEKLGQVPQPQNDNNQVSSDDQVSQPRSEDDRVPQPEPKCSNERRKL